MSELCTFAGSTDASPEVRVQGTQVIEQKGKVPQRSSPTESKCKTRNFRRGGSGGLGDDEAFDLQMTLRKYMRCLLL